MLALLVYGTRLHHAGRYPQVVTCAMVAAPWGLIVVGAAGLIAGWTLLVRLGERLRGETRPASAEI